MAYLWHHYNDLPIAVPGCAPGPYSIGHLDMTCQPHRSVWQLVQACQGTSRFGPGKPSPGHGLTFKIDSYSLIFIYSFIYIYMFIIYKLIYLFNSIYLSVYWFIIIVYKIGLFMIIYLYLRILHLNAGIMPTIGHGWSIPTCTIVH